jgi:hypothetical protein
MEETFPERQFNLILRPVWMKLTKSCLFNSSRRPAQLEKGIKPLCWRHLPQDVNLIVIRFHNKVFWHVET